LKDAQGVDVPAERDPGHVYHLFVIRVRDRANVQTSLASSGIETLIHYPVPIPRQPALAGMNPADCPAAARACDEVLSLPLHPGLSDQDIETVAALVQGRSAYTG
jgi:dTDP-4-amino-4,6-dideoxygalactose transaminase